MFKTETVREIYLLIRANLELSFKQVFHDFIKMNGLEVYSDQQGGFYAVKKDQFLGTSNNCEVEMAYFGPFEGTSVRFAKGEFETGGVWVQLPAIIVNGNFQKSVEEFLNQSELKKEVDYHKKIISS